MALRHQKLLYRNMYVCSLNFSYHLIIFGFGTKVEKIFLGYLKLHICTIYINRLAYKRPFFRHLGP